VQATSSAILNPYETVVSLFLLFDLDITSPLHIFLASIYLHSLSYSSAALLLLLDVLSLVRLLSIPGFQGTVMFMLVLRHVFPVLPQPCMPASHGPIACPGDNAGSGRSGRQLRKARQISMGNIQPDGTGRGYMAHGPRCRARPEWEPFDMLKSPT
jgi:hypothetical protein